MTDRELSKWGVLFAVAVGTGCGDSGSAEGGSGGATSVMMSTGESTAVPLPTTGEIDATSTGDTTSPPTTGPTSEPTSGSSTTGAVATCEDACPPDFLCKYGVCIPNLGPCRTYDDCPGDSYCDADGQCIPYDVPPGVINDPECKKINSPDGVTPTLQCEWRGPSDPKDPTKLWTRVYTAPTIGDLNLDKDPDKLQPSIVVTTFFEENDSLRAGMLRVFDGRTCEEQMRIGGPDELPDLSNRPSYGTTWALGDLDDDVSKGGHPELVGFHFIGNPEGAIYTGSSSLYAMRVDSSGVKPELERMWYGRDCANNDQIVEFSDEKAFGSPLLLDLDDDAFPEIIVGEMVFDADGCLLTDIVPYTADITGMVYMPLVADVDLDGKPDLVTHQRTAGWNAKTSMWEDKPWFVVNPTARTGLFGLADAGAYSALAGVGSADLPELVVVSMTKINFEDTGTIRLQAITGETVWGPIELYRDNSDPAGHGGPPTISDFDGDGQVEFAAAASKFYAVYDPDCVAALQGMSPPERPGGKCERAAAQQAKNLPDGVLWAQPSQDLSSSFTGSSIFDFDGDGKAEAVYRDECYVRVYDGGSGAVLFSAPASSRTGLEYPTIADVDGDYATEIVVPRTEYAACPAVDPLYPDSGTFYSAGGFVIYRDPLDRWANSRPVWNQHAYSVTHIRENLTVPPASEFVNNWQSDGLNNFRQNIQGGFGLLQIADLTVELTDLGSLCDLKGGTKELKAEVCNRGTYTVKDGVTVAFLETDDPAKGFEEAVVVCSAVTSKLLNPGECEVVACVANLGGNGNIYVDVDPADEIADCHPGNNLGADAFEICPG